MNENTSTERDLREVIEKWNIMGDTTPEQYSLLSHNRKIIWAVWPELAQLLEDLIWKYIERNNLMVNVEDNSQESQNTEEVSGQGQETPEGE